MRRISESGFYILMAVAMIVYYAGRDDDGGVRRPPPKLPANVDIQDDAGRPSAPPRVGLPEYNILDSGQVQDASGSAVSVDGRGLYMTARHVVHGCSSVYIEADKAPSGKRRWMKAERIVEHPFADLALIDLGERTPGTVGSATELGTRPVKRQAGVFVGYPQSNPGTVTASALGEVNVRFKPTQATQFGRSQVFGQTLKQARRAGNRGERGYAWAESRRYPNFSGSLGGLSGGPAFSEDGVLVGIVIAEARRRGRVITSQPANMETLTGFSGGPVEAFRKGEVADQGDSLRADRVSAFVFCDAD